MESKVDKLDVVKLVPVPVDLSKISDIVKNDVVKKDVYNAKIKNIEEKIPDITNLATNAFLNAIINEVKGEMPSITILATNASLDAKINNFKGEIPNTGNLATTTTGLNAVENKVPNASNLFKKKTQYNIKISEIENKTATDHDHDKYITTQKINKLISENFTAKLKQANLASKNDIVNFVNRTYFNNKTKKCYIK